MLKSLAMALKNTLIALLITLLVLLAIEFAFRAFGLAPARLPPFTMAFTTSHPVMGFAAQPNAKWWVDMTPQGLYTTRYHGSTDAQGYRPLRHNADCSTCKTIVALGDSMTFGIESEDTATWPELLAKKMSLLGKPVKVRNISYRGWGTLQQALALEEFAKTGAKADLVILMVVPNDAGDNVVRSYYTSSPIMSLKDGQLNLLPPQEPGELAKMDRVWRTEKWVRQSALATYVYRKGGADLQGEDTPLFPFDFSDDSYRSVMWSEAGQNSLKEALKSLSDADPDALLKQKAFVYALQRMKKTADAMGAKLLVTTAAPFAVAQGKHAPALQQLLKMTDAQFLELASVWQSHLNDVQRLAQSAGAIYIDNRLALDDLDYRQYAAQPIDWHHSTEANAFYARHLAPQLMPY